MRRAHALYADRSAYRLTHWDPGSPPSRVPAILLALSKINLLRHAVVLPDGFQEVGGSAPARREWASSRCWWSVCVRKKALYMWSKLQVKMGLADASGARG